MRELHIALDIDGVLADFAGGMLPHLSAALGREVTEEHITEYHFERALRIEPSSGRPSGATQTASTPRRHRTRGSARDWRP